MAFCSKRSRGTTVQLLVPSSGGGGCELISLKLDEGWEDRSVDLGAIGRLAALDPISIRINGYMLGARPPDYIAAAVTWGSLLSHFAARRLPTGGPAGDPIFVHGRPIPSSAAAKRRISSDGESPLKKGKLMLKDDPNVASSHDVSGPFFASRGAGMNCLARDMKKRSREDDLVMAELPSKRIAW